MDDGCQAVSLKEKTYARSPAFRAVAWFAGSTMDPFDYCNRRAADNTPSLSCTVGGSGGRAGLPAV
eukprot:CAMPEP_0181216920 /NCGR_PEP_ID=MMETSP1096-20121128/26857_1 /TAXON_ID=156174 ORGANISM="Chrysochromulina ericina, Strain CCMP281" /NCGR_SAMPLE_ID=MMETSP1096 /ASSEMBLY_ACC=CAM_ASM_000453 /LENGTH=65 /DNA_ID=CAMNT_0023308981 /DNA_START=215 /DNA_END=409 /DNA_ORIENTATION=-